MDSLYPKLERGSYHQGVAVNWCTCEAIRRLPPLRKPPAILSLGCGRGRQVIALASHFRTVVEAVDPCPGELDRVVETAQDTGLAQWVKPRLHSISEAPDPPFSFDLIWCDVAARAMGLRQILSRWAPRLRRRGVLALSAFSWLARPSSPDLAPVVERLQPKLTEPEETARLAHAAELEIYDSFALPRSTWCDTAVANMDFEAKMIARVAECCEVRFYLMRRV